MKRSRSVRSVYIEVTRSNVKSIERYLRARIDGDTFTARDDDVCRGLLRELKAAWRAAR